MRSLRTILAVLLVSTGLTACAATLDKSGPGLALGTAADNVATSVKGAGEAVTAVGTATGNPLLIGGGALLSTLAATWLGYRKIKSEDAKPFTTEDAASMKAAMAVHDATASAPTLKPVG